MNQKQIKAAVEAMLFAAGDPVGADKLAAAVQLPQTTVETALEDLRVRYAREDSGLCLLHLDTRWQLATKTEWADCIRRLLDARRSVPLGPAAMETLTVIAYNQPVSRAFIEQVRGVDSSSSVSGLLQKGLIEEAGRLDLPGHPVSFRMFSCGASAFPRWRTCRRCAEIRKGRRRHDGSPDGSGLAAADPAEDRRRPAPDPVGAAGPRPALPAVRGRLLGGRRPDRPGRCAWAHPAGVPVACAGKARRIRRTERLLGKAESEAPRPPRRAQTEESRCKRGEETEKRNKIRVCLGVRGEDPAEAARAYGRLNAWLYSSLGVIDRFVYLDFDELRILPDFGSAEPTVADRVSFHLSARLLFIVAAALRVLYEFWREKVLDVFL